MASTRGNHGCTWHTSTLFTECSTYNTAITLTSDTHLRAWLSKETLLQKHCCRRKCFPVKLHEHMLRRQLWHCGSTEMFLNQVKNSFASQTQIWLPKRYVSQLATQGNMFPQQCFLVFDLIQKHFLASKTKICFRNICFSHG